MAKIVIKDGELSSSAPINFKVGGISSSLSINSSSIDIENAYLTLPELSEEPQTPPAGKIAIYASFEDSKLYFKNDFGDVYCLVSGSSTRINPSINRITRTNTEGNYIIDLSNELIIINFDSDNDVFLTLPSATQLDGKKLIIKRGNNAFLQKKITVLPSDNNTVELTSSLEIWGPFQSKTLIADSSSLNWVVV